MSPNLADFPPVGTPPQYASLLLVDPDTVRGWIDSGELAASNVASRSSRRPRYRITREALAAFLEARQPTTRPPATRRRRSQTDVMEYF